MRRDERELLKLPSLFPPPGSPTQDKPVGFVWVCLTSLAVRALFGALFIALFVALLLGYLGHVDRGSQRSIKYLMVYQTHVRDTRTTMPKMPGHAQKQVF